jgi:hypothetical protein
MKGTPEFYTVFLFLYSLIIPIFLWIWQLNLWPFLRKRVACCTTGLYYYKQGVGKCCISKIRDKTGWVYKAWRVFSDWLSDCVVEQMFVLHKKGLCGVGGNKESGDEF